MSKPNARMCVTRHLVLPLIPTLGFAATAVHVNIGWRCLILTESWRIL
jgi:hypothetical protein